MAGTGITTGITITDRFTIHIIITTIILLPEIHHPVIHREGDHLMFLNHQREVYPDGKSHQAILHEL